MEIAIECQMKERETELPPRNQDVILNTTHFRRIAFRDLDGIWRWKQNKETVAEKIIAWEALY